MRLPDLKLNDTFSLAVAAALMSCANTAGAASVNSQATTSNHATHSHLSPTGERPWMKCVGETRLDDPNAAPTPFGIVFSQEPRNRDLTSADVFLLNSAGQNVKQIGHAEVVTATEPDDILFHGGADSPFAFELRLHLPGTINNDSSPPGSGNSGASLSSMTKNAAAAHSTGSHAISGGASAASGNNAMTKSSTTASTAVPTKVTRAAGTIDMVQLFGQNYLSGINVECRAMIQAESGTNPKFSSAGNQRSTASPQHASSATQPAVPSTPSNPES